MSSDNLSWFHLPDGCTLYVINHQPPAEIRHWHRYSIPKQLPTEKHWVRIWPTGKAEVVPECAAKAQIEHYIDKRHKGEL